MDQQIIVIFTVFSSLFYVISLSYQFKIIVGEISLTNHQFDKLTILVEENLDKLTIEKLPLQK